MKRKFKVGDKVRVVKSFGVYNPKPGTIGVVTKILPSSGLVRCNFTTFSKSMFDFELALVHPKPRRGKGKRSANHVHRKESQ